MSAPPLYPVGMSTPAPRADWAAVYDADPDALPTQSPTWSDAIQRCGNHVDVSRHYVLRDGAHAILPLFARRHVPSAAMVLRSPPSAWGFGGFLATRQLSSFELRSMLQDLARTHCACIQIRPNPLKHDLWAEASPPGWIALPRTAHVVDLGGGFETVWSSRFRSDARNRVRRAERAGVTVVSGTDPSLFGDLHRLLSASVDRWAIHQQEPAALARLRFRLRDPLSKFLAIAAAAGSMVRVWVARIGTAPVAALMVLKDRHAHYTRGAMDETLAGPSYANYLLHARAIEEACRSGCRYYHMGETGNSSSLARFKTRFGAHTVPYAEYRFERYPLLSMDQRLRAAVKAVMGFRDA